MRFLIDAGELLQGLKNNVARRSTLPIIEHVVIRADTDDSTVTVESTDTEKYVTVTLPAKVTESGAGTARPDQLKALLGRLDGEVQVVHEDHLTRVLQTGQGRARRYQFESHNVDDWPGFREEDARTVALDPTVLALAIDKLAYCADTSYGDKPFCWGVQMRSGYVAAQSPARFALVPWRTELPDMVIPLDSLSVLRPLLDAPNVAAWVYGDTPRALELFTDTDRVVTRLVDTKPPPLLDVVGKMDELGDLASFDAADAIAALARVNPLGASNFDRKDVGLDVSVEAGRVVLSTSNGAAQDEFPADTNTNLPACHINGVFLADALQHLEGRVTWELLQMAGQPAPASRLKCEGRDDFHLFAHRLLAVRKAA